MMYTVKFQMQNVAGKGGLFEKNGRGWGGVSLSAIVEVVERVTSQVLLGS